MVARFVAGETLEEALAVCERLREAGMRTTVDVLGESVASSAQAEAAADRYIETLDALAERGLDGNVSVKPRRWACTSTRPVPGEHRSGRRPRGRAA